MEMLIVGGSGFLGAELVRRAVAADHATAATYSSRPPRDRGQPVAWYRLDLREPVQVQRVMAEARPQVVINASSGLADWGVTAEAPLRLALAAARSGSRLIHVSSDAVFSGRLVHYNEAQPPDPVTPYGAAKAAAETGVRLVHPGSVVARTSLIIGGGRSEHERLVRQLAAGTRAGALFTDDVRCPVHVTDLAEALLELAASQAHGVHHLGGADALSRHELGFLIARRDGLDTTRLPTGLRAESPHPDPLDVRLDSRATQRKLRTGLRGAREFLSNDRSCPPPGSGSDVRPGRS
ncbi:sugar nucleotide-binding protein [Streptomyces fragilis]|uniref:Sugar nucleotide-binding protein n=1 Tax=Streptomyces fragilis TaxID=67301 RepID=A0ABV2YCE5_9ACTN|nr:sugar nucleotide-binding protein [Streptomyces fragilis]